MTDDLGLKVMTKEEAFWTNVKKDSEAEREKVEESYFKSRLFHEGVIRLAEQELNRIALENDSSS